jgi:pseudaminic acid synthase
MEKITIQTPKGERRIGPGEKTFIIAELSGNHNGQYDRALRLVDEAIKAGVDAIKLQTYTKDTMTIDCDNEWFQVKVNEAWSGQTLYELYEKAYTPWEWHKKLKAYAEEKGVMLFSTPFDETAVDFLEEVGNEVYKVASFETGDLHLLKRIGQTKKPVIISRGLTGKEELALAIQTLKEAGCPAIAVLHCVSSYPARPEQMNLRTIPYLKKEFNVIAGLSDHSLGIVVPLTAVGLGASIIEKHFTLDREEGGPDAEFSLEPAEMKELVSSIREAELAIGEPTLEIGRKEKENLVFRRSIFVIKDMEKGEQFNSENTRVIRPGYGLSPKHYEEVITAKAKQRIERGTPLQWDLIEQ